MRNYNKSMGVLTLISIPICAYVWYASMFPAEPRDIQSAHFDLKLVNLLQEEAGEVDELPRFLPNGTIINDYGCNLKNIKLAALDG
jgi:hypothetical protein